jgi:hypothetical protein
MKTRCAPITGLVDTVSYPLSGVTKIGCVDYVASYVQHMVHGFITTIEWWRRRANALE